MKSKVSKILKKRVDINWKSIKLWTVLLFVAGVGMLGGSGYVWYQNIFTNEERIFYGMISESLSTSSVSRTINQNQGQTRFEDQSFYLKFSPDPIIKSTSKVEQTDQNREKSTVVTETLGIKGKDYVRYTSIEVPENSADTTDYSKVLGVWAERETDAEIGATAQFMDEAIFTLVPFGNFEKSQKNELVQMIKDKEVYKFGKDGRIVNQDSRPVYKMTVTVNPRSLVEVLSKYNELTGLGDASQLKPEGYADQYVITVSLTIDMISKHLKEVNFTGDGRTERYEAYGVTQQVKQPEDAITVEELQTLIQ